MCDEESHQHVALERARNEIESMWADADRLAHGSGGRSPTASAPKPDPTLAWVAGLGAMTAFGFVEWPIAAVLAASHAIQRYSHNQAFDQLAAGIEEGA